MYHGHNQKRQCQPAGHQRQPGSPPSSPVEAQSPQDPSSPTAAGSPATSWSSPATSCTTTPAATTPTTTTFTAPTSMSTRRSAGNPALALKLEQMAMPLAPLVQMTTGRVHPAFPRTLLHFWVLTDAQLDSLAHFYHQRTPGYWTSQYPCPVRWGPNLPLEEKRRKMGMFIGLRGCESPILLAGSAEELLEEARRQAVIEEGADDALIRKAGSYE
ncbi:hypothetical protein GGTG_10257 [Gaeumannomyces tritici R3-111a-1]|uniref:Beta-xylosidase n=1 Tax=Gaeumannomyces tritici (strain R3-111a-1) TaxID=644352 RepID=J3P9T3_GAET3|nr:hypothetical protein GGTG_10257 [Gaeumannomyces tritici R3-111a-1]EJT73419.1 hypothetical protein GGTG_10257 [Gaeumannomyces tritici R3-111a-1]